MEDIDPSQYIALDTEMVDTTLGIEPTQVSILDFEGNVIFNQYFKPSGAYLTEPSKNRKKLLHKIKNKLVNYNDYKDQITAILKDKVIIGHDLASDFKALGLDVHDYKVLDTAFLEPFMGIKYDPMTLKKLAKIYLNRVVQSKIHDAREDAKASLNLLRTYDVNLTPRTISELRPKGYRTQTLKRRNRNQQNNLIQFPQRRTANNYARNMEGLFTPNLIQFPQRRTANNYARNMEGLFTPDLIQFPQKRTANNYARNMEGLFVPNLIQFPERRTVNNYAKNIEGLFTRRTRRA